jgi:hypothetical protein
MRRLATLLSLLFIASSSHAASNYDRPAVVKVWEKKCEQDHLQRPEDMTNLAIMNISLASLCECVSTQVVSRMSDDDITYMATTLKLNQATLDMYIAARKFCATMLMR